MNKECKGATNEMAVRLVSPTELSEILNVPVSWIYHRTMMGPSAIPFVKIGKYVRFNTNEVLRFLEKQKSDGENAAVRRYSI